MAKLSAHEKEVLRVSREQERTLEQDDLCSWARTTCTFHSDGKSLEKLDVRFRPDRYHVNGESHSYGWKVRGRVKASIMADLGALAQSYRERGWTVEHFDGSFAASVQERIA